MGRKAADRRPRRDGSDVDDPYRMIAHGLSEINAHLVQGATWFPGRGGASLWGEKHSRRYNARSPPFSVLESVEAYFEFMGKHDQNAPSVEIMKKNYSQGGFGESLFFAADAESWFRAFLKEHQELRKKIEALSGRWWLPSCPSRNRD